MKAHFTAVAIPAMSTHGLNFGIPAFGYLGIYFDQKKQGGKQ
jgi:hypothetical protein